MAISSEEKRVFLEEIVPLAFDPSSKGIVHSKHCEFFLRETMNGKMYKYRSFDANGYSLDNLSTNTLYCSKVTEFNDPFDSRLGVEIEQFSRSLLKNNTEFRREVYTETQEYLKHFGIKASLEEIEKAKEESIPIQSVAGIFGVKGDKDGNDLTMEMAKILNLGDPDKVRHDIEAFEEMERINMETMNRHFVVGCLATSPKNCLMWSHYAECHRGFCIEYDFNEIKNTTLPFPIVYSSDRPQIPWDVFFNSSTETRSNSLIQYAIGLLIKDRAWEYENEWRVLLPATRPPKLPVPITGVYLGACISPENREKILKIANEKHIPVKQMKTDRGKYELHAVEI